MKTFFLSPDYKCSERCLFCPCAENARQYTPLTLEEMKESLDVAIETAGIEMVLLSGGEPTLTKEIMPFIRYVREKNIKFGILSNSLKFANTTYLNKFIDVAGTQFEVTTAFHSYIAEHHDKITGLSNSFAKSLEGVKNLMNAGVQVIVKHNINKQTYRELPEYTDWIYNTFPDTIPWVLCNLDVCGIAMKNREKIAVLFSETKHFVEQALDKVIEYAKQHGRKRMVHILNTPLCTIDPYYWEFLKKSEGGVMPALRLPYEKPEDNLLKINLQGDCGAIFAPCQSCALQPKCPGTWSKTGEMYVSEFKPFN